jgi:hypothetical protein
MILDNYLNDDKEYLKKEIFFHKKIKKFIK